jgi:Subtilase family
MPAEPRQHPGWVAGGQPDVLQGHGFLYRPRQILFEAGRAWSPTVTTRLQQDGGEPDNELNEEFAGAKLPVRAYLMPPGVNIPRLVAQLRERGAGDPMPNVGPNHVFCGEPNYEGGPDGEPVDATAINEASYGQPDPKAPTIAVLDTGYDPSVPVLHPGLVPRVGYPAGSEEDPMSGNYIAAEGGHGTFIDGVIMRLAPKAPIRQLRVLSPAGITDDACLALALPKANAPVINLSLGGYTQGDVPPVASGQALAQLDPGVAVVAAAGNHSSAESFWPAAFGRVMSVGALDTTNGQPARASFSNYGHWVNIYAPGVKVRSTYLDATWKLPTDPAGWRIYGWATWNGTSFAAPQVAAAIANHMTQAGGTAYQASLAVLAAARWVPGPAGGPWPGGWSYIPQPGVIG